MPKVSCICVSNGTPKPGNFNSAISNENLLLFRKWYITTPEIVYPLKEPNTCVSRNPFLFNFYEIFEIIIEEIINYYSMKKKMRFTTMFPTIMINWKLILLLKKFLFIKKLTYLLDFDKNIFWPTNENHSFTNFLMIYYFAVVVCQKTNL